MRKSLIGLAALLILSGCAKLPSPTVSAEPTPSVQQAQVQAIAVPQLSSAQLAALPVIDTNANVPAPVDNTTSATDGLVLHSDTELALFDQPGGKPFGRLPTKQLGNPTWLPIVDSQLGWFKVLLPSKPNGSTGWLDASKVVKKHTPYLIQVNLTTKKLTLIDGNKVVGSWDSAIGAADTPTPTGRTFLLASIKDPSQSFSPIILPLGTHSATLDSYGGGPGTVALHTWPDTSVFGKAVSHGCVRVPAKALQMLEQVPLGTVVQITS